MLIFFAVYLVRPLLILVLIWAALDIAKWDDTDRGYDLLEDHISSFE